jgi:hypothetical protein
MAAAVLQLMGFQAVGRCGTWSIGSTGELALDQDPAIRAMSSTTA